MPGRNDNTRAAASEEDSGDRLRRSTTGGALSVDLVSAFSGDRELTEAERALVDASIQERGSVFFSDLLYAISHHYFAPEIARTLWDEVLQHKHGMSKRLGRNVRITVATLDYFSNIKGAFVSPTVISEAYVSEIATLSMRDGLTGLYNHSTCYELLELELRRHRRYGTGVSLIMLDIDDFKLVNDRCGHQEGDRILVALARTMTEQVRDSDICCRLGGEEFIAILPSTGNPTEACEIAERVREQATHIVGGEHGITVSAGVAVCGSVGSSARALIEIADRALFLAKRAGKNRVVLG